MAIHSEDSEKPVRRPPTFKVRYPGSEAWDTESVGSGEALAVAADFLGPLTAADIIARHWLHSGRSDDIRAMANHLLAVHRRLTQS